MPLFLLAAVATVWISRLVSRRAMSRGLSVRLGIPVSGSLVALAVTAMLWREGSFTTSLLTRPTPDWFPETDQWGTFGIAGHLPD